MSASQSEALGLQKRSFRSEETSATADVTIGLLCRPSVDWTKELFIILRSRLNIKIVELAVNNGANLDKLDIDDDTPLHLALRLENIEAAKLFIKRGADVNSCSYSYSKMEITPFHLAIIMEDIELIELCLEHGADVNPDPLDPYIPGTPGRRAVDTGNVKVIELLLKYEAQISALHIAAYQGNLEAIKFRLKHGAELENRDLHGKTPFNVAEDKCNYDAMRLLLDMGANIDNVDQSGHTALHKASKSRDFEMVKFLIERTANVGIFNKEGKTPLDLTTNLEIIELFKSVD